MWALIEGDVVKSCLATVEADGVWVGWSMATPKALQRQGRGSRMLSSVIGLTAQEDPQWGLC